MKKQSQAVKNRNGKAAVSQPQNTPTPVRTSPDNRAGERRETDDIPLTRQPPQFQFGEIMFALGLSEQEQARLDDALFIRNGPQPIEHHLSHEQFCRDAIIRHANRHLRDQPLTEFEDAIAQAVAMIHILASRCGELEELRGPLEESKRISFGEFHLAEMAAGRLSASYESVRSYAVGLPSK